MSKYSGHRGSALPRGGSDRAKGAGKGITKEAPKNVKKGSSGFAGMKNLISKSGGKG